MWQHRRKVLFVLVASVISSLAMIGMMIFLLAACGIHMGWLLALLSLPAGVAVGVSMARPMSRQFLKR